MGWPHRNRVLRVWAGAFDSLVLGADKGGLHATVEKSQTDVPLNPTEAKP
jgi:hypothetical protein